MGVVLAAVTLDARDPEALRRFWAGVLGVLPNEDIGFGLWFPPSDQPKAGQNQLHFDLTSTSADDQRQQVERAIALGARHIDVGQRPEEGHVVLADPEGNEFCVVGPGNNFLAGCPLLGCLTCEGSAEVGYFWSEALGWPLVWDRDQETAIQSPRGGTKISWGGPPLKPKTGRRRVRLELAPAQGSDQHSEVQRLLRLGASLLDSEPGRGEVHLADPDGNEFSVLPDNL